MKEIVIYLGPSLPLAEARKILSARYLPPIKRGDLEKIRSPQKTVVGVIDGVFHQSESVSILELRQFIEKGGVAYGASSMGAMRAVDLAPLGMIGIGQIFRNFRSGRLNSDADVALTFCPETGQLQTYPTVQIQAILAHAKKNGVLSALESTKALRRAKKIYYAERTKSSLRHVWGQILDASRVRQLVNYLDHGSIDPKRLDAMKLLTYLAQCYGLSSTTGIGASFKSVGHNG